MEVHTSRSRGDDRQTQVLRYALGKVCLEYVTVFANRSTKFLRPRDLVGGHARPEIVFVLLPRFLARRQGCTRHRRASGPTSGCCGAGPGAVRSSVRCQGGWARRRVLQTFFPRQDGPRPCRPSPSSVPLRHVRRVSSDSTSCTRSKKPRLPAPASRVAPRQGQRQPHR